MLYLCSALSLTQQNNLNPFNPNQTENSYKNRGVRVNLVHHLEMLWRWWPNDLDRDTDILFLKPTLSINLNKINFFGYQFRNWEEDYWNENRISHSYKKNIRWKQINLWVNSFGTLLVLIVKYSTPPLI